MDKILVISTEPALTETLASELPEFTVIETSPKEAASHLQNQNFRLILTDDTGADTLPVTTKVPVIKLIRPIRLARLLYTIRTQLQSKTTFFKEDLMISPDFTLLSAERVIRSSDNGIRIALTEKEVELLICLLEHRNEPISRDFLLKLVWGYSDDIATHTLETHIYRLRGKLHQATPSLDIMFSEEGGYRLSTS